MDLQRADVAGAGWSVIALYRNLIRHLAEKQELIKIHLSFSATNKLRTGGMDPFVVRIDRAAARKPSERHANGVNLATHKC